MKKVFSRLFNAILILAVIVALCPVVETKAEEDVSAYIMDGTVITGYNGPGGDITLPAVATGVADYAFAGNASISSITVPANVTSVGSYSFSGCTGMTSAVFQGAASVGSGAFYGCSSLGYVELPAGLGAIEAETFDGCGSLASVSIPEGVTSIGAQAFNGCGSLGAIGIPSTVTEIGSSAFNNCVGLSEISIPSSVTSMGSGVLAGCSGLASVSLSGGMSEIPELTLYGCSSLGSISIPGSVGSIGAQAFGNCTGLTSITIPAGASSVDLSAFDGCSNLSDVSVESGNGSYASYEGSVYDSSLTQLLYCPVGKSSLKLPSGITSIASSSFSNCPYVYNLELPDTVTTIEADAFSGSGIGTVTIPASVTSIGSQSSWVPDVIYGYTGSEAERFAEDNGYIFESLGGEEADPNPDELTGTVTVTSSRDGGSSYPGDTLTAEVTDTNNSGDLSYQWYADDSSISGATDDSYELTEEEIGTLLTVRVTSSVETGSIQGVYEGTIKEEGEDPDPKGLTGTVTVTSSRDGGSSYPGDTLTAEVTDTNNTGDLSYQWYANDTSISGATDDSYELTEDEIGTLLTVRVTSSVESGSIQGVYEGTIKREGEEPDPPTNNPGGTGGSGVSSTSAGGTSRTSAGSSVSRNMGTAQVKSSTPKTGVAFDPKYVLCVGIFLAGTCLVITKKKKSMKI